MVQYAEVFKIVCSLTANGTKFNSYESTYICTFVMFKFRNSFAMDENPSRNSKSVTKLYDPMVDVHWSFNYV